MGDVESVAPADRRESDDVAGQDEAAEVREPETQASEPPEPLPEVPPKLGRVVSTFVEHVDSLAGSLPDAMFAVQTAARMASDRFDAYAGQYGSLVSKDGEAATYSFKPPYDLRAGRLAARSSQASVASDMLPRMYVIALVGQFDAFLGRMLRAVFLKKPELIEASDRAITFSQLVSLGTVDSAKEYVLEKEIETVLRNSHPSQFTWMENKFGVELRKGLPSWQTFVEVTERRNLFAHTDGVVSDQYLANCKENGVPVAEGCVRGSRLTVDPDYLRAAHACMFEIGVKLAQVLWRKLFPDEMDDADSSLINVSFDLIVAKRYELAVNLLEFGCCTLKRHASDQNKKTLEINRAQAYKWSGDGETCQSVLASQDWSASGPVFQLALAVLNDEFQRAATVMMSVGAQGDMSESGYQEWPLFKEFRQSQEFAGAYESVFGKPFVHLEKTLKESEREQQRAALEALRKSLEDDIESVLPA